ncbi:glycosyltransferase family 2 protein [Stenotrophomonas sp. NPDC078853]|uniref:glycosyltransferase family 2 protein n=1 Tax=Stenotrophomonas sp. NPDC078853 TaxID=3364534 RepID=UPI00384FE4D7
MSNPSLKMPPFFSVVIPTYNRSDSISRTLRSVMGQSFSDFECIVVDDGSADIEKLMSVVESLNDSRFKVVTRENGGGGAARNTGIDACAGRYIAFLDSDDLFTTDKLQRFFDVLSVEPHQAMYSYANVDRGVIGKMWQRPDRPIAAQESMGSYLFISNQFVQTSTIVIQKDVAGKVRFDPALRKGQDLDFCLRLDKAGVRFQMLERPLVIWTDVSEIGRTSRHAGAKAPTEWLRTHSHLMTPQEIMGYRATVLAYYQPKYKFLTVGKDLLAGVLIAKVPARIAMRQLLRFSLPRGVYRGLVSFAVKKLSQKAAAGEPSAN